MRAYQIAGINMLEFDIQTKYLPYRIKNEILSEEEMVQYFIDYYEDVENHYIFGVFYRPIISDIKWNGGITKVYNPQNNKEIEIKIYIDRYSKMRCYNIIFICDNKTYTQFDYDGERIDNFYDARLYATYLIEMYIQKKNNP